MKEILEWEVFDDKKYLKTVFDILKNMTENRLVKVFLELLYEDIANATFRDTDISFFRIVTIHFHYMNNDYKRVYAFYLLNFIVTYLLLRKIIDYRTLPALFI